MFQLIFYFSLLGKSYWLFALQSIKFNLKYKFHYWKCSWTLKYAYLIPKLCIEHYSRLKGYLEMLVT